MLNKKINKILFVYEGKTAEPKIARNMQSVFFDQNKTVIESVFGTDIYQLYKLILADEGLDIVGIIKERDKVLTNYVKEEFSEIYLFFDYDGHATGASDVKISELLEFFNEESENGKLYISYPMVEAIKHLPCKDAAIYKELFVNCKENKHGDEKCGYKELVPKDCCDKSFISISNYDITKWQLILNLHLCKMNYIVNNDCSLPILSFTKLISQKTVFENQLQKYITPHQKVGVLSAFPVFIHDYFGNQKTLELIQTSDEDQT